MISKKKYQLTLSTVHMVYRLINSTFDVKGLLLRLTRLVCQLIGADSASVHILDSLNNRVAIVAVFNGKSNKLFDKKSRIPKISPEERKVLMGRSLMKKNLIGIPLVAEDNMGAIFIGRKRTREPFSNFDRELLTVMAEQVVTAIKNLQLYESHQKIILGSIKSIGRLLERQAPSESTHAPVYFRVVHGLAEELNMRRSEIQSLQYASILHDAGVIDVPYEILSKSSHLTPNEFTIIRNHPAKSVELIRPVEFLKPVLPIILYHHEKYDGTGYPSGLKKEQIPLGARVMAVVDAFEAMLRLRPYRRTLSIAEALEELQENSGTQFDPKIVKAFIRLSKQKKFRNCLSSLKK